MFTINNIHKINFLMIADIVPFVLLVVHFLLALLPLPLNN